MMEIVLQENVLTDNVLVLPGPGKIFKGDYIAIIKEYKYQSAWSDREHITRFRELKSLKKYISKNYPDKGLESLIHILSQD